MDMNVDQNRVERVLAAIMQDVEQRPIARRSGRGWLWVLFGTGFYAASVAVMLTQARVVATIWTWLIAVLWPSLLMLLFSHGGVWLLWILVLLGIGTGIRSTTRTRIRR